RQFIIYHDNFIFQTLHPPQVSFFRMRNSVESASSVFILPTFTGKSQIFLLFLYIIFKGDAESN
ncbi:MAG TPA: hypothetical protein DD663_11640, partial [Exiguobacterium sp.]|nr:hypothetical protein [Exiguobacterium sp.]